jgi:hypothetical protein
MGDKATRMSNLPVLLTQKGTESVYLMGISLENGIKKDFVTDAVEAITVEHSNIHNGYFFESPRIIDMGAGTVHSIGIKTPEDKYIHYRNEKLSTSADNLRLVLHEGATIEGGTTATAINHNRTSDITASVIVKSGVTVSSVGTTVSIAYVGGGTGQGQSRAGGETSQENEYVLKKDTQYVITLTNSSSGVNTVFVSPQWYEEEEG